MQILEPSTTPTTRQVWPRISKPTEPTATVTCVKEDDGHHVHDYRTTVPVAGRMTLIRIEHHLHAWMDDHKRRYPTVKDVDAHDPQKRLIGYWDTVEEAWETLMVDGPIPSVVCQDPNVADDELDDVYDYATDLNEADCGGVVDGFGQVHSDADPGL